MNLISIFLLVITYFAPSLSDRILNGNVRSHVFVVNLFLGWTVVIWVYCYIWVFQERRRKRRRRWHTINVRSMKMAFYKQRLRAEAMTQKGEEEVRTYTIHTNQIFSLSSLFLLAFLFVLTPTYAVGAVQITEGPSIGSVHTGHSWGEERYGETAWVRVDDTKGLENIESVTMEGPTGAFYMLHDNGASCDDGPNDGVYGQCDEGVETTPPALGTWTVTVYNKDGDQVTGTDTIERVLDFPRSASPDNVVVTNSTPEFRWDPVAGATNYSLDIRDNDWNLIWERGGIIATSVTYNDDGFAQNLQEGVRYQWGMGANDDDGNYGWHNHTMGFIYSSNPGTISGKVLDTQGNPIANVCVNANSAMCWGSWALGDVTDGEGKYSITIPSGDYYIVTSVSCNTQQYYQDEWWNNSDGTIDCNQAVPVSVSEGQETPNIDFSLLNGGIISGRITNSAGDPITNVCLAATDGQCGGNNWYGAQTDSNGEYFIPVPEGISYYVQANASCSGQNFALEWWNPGDGSYDCNDATPIGVTTGDTTGNIDFTLEQGATITGTVYESDGATPIANMEIIAALGILAKIRNTVDGHIRMKTDITP